MEVFPGQNPFSTQDSALKPLYPRTTTRNYKSQMGDLEAI
jgi:hypothetical protein